MGYEKRRQETNSQHDLRERATGKEYPPTVSQGVKDQVVYFLSQDSWRTYLATDPEGQKAQIRQMQRLVDELKQHTQNSLVKQDIQELTAEMNERVKPQREYSLFSEEKKQPDKESAVSRILRPFRKRS